MPCNGSKDYKFLNWRHTEAARQIRAKFPDLIEGSSGWSRAVENRKRRIRSCS